MAVDSSIKEVEFVANIVAGWQPHFQQAGVTAADIALYAEQIDRPFLLEQRQAYLGKRR